MALFLTWFAKRYSPYDIDNGKFAFFMQTTRTIPLVCTQMIADDGYGVATVNGKKISKGKCVKFDFSPLPFYFLPVGEVATEFDKTYTVELKGYRTVGGGKFINKKFTFKTPSKRFDDGKHTANEQVAKGVSDEGIVLLENNGILPLARNSQITLLGEYYNYRITAIGAGLIKPRWTLTIEEAIKKSQSISVTDDAQTALYFISRGSGENKDNKPIKGGYYLTDAEKEGLKQAVEKYKNLILILNTGDPIEMGFIKSLGVSAVIWTGFSGQRGSESLIDILTGKVNPSGRLADTWALDYYDHPSAHNFINLDEKAPTYTDDGKKVGATVYYEERQFVGYRYFDSFEKSVAYPFGHGLSYTDFNVTATAEFANGILTVNAAVTNMGKSDGKTSVLVYVQSPSGRLTKPKRAFCGFDKTKLLAANEKQTLEMQIPTKDFAVYDDKQKAFILEQGEYSVYVGGSIEKAEKVSCFTLDTETVVDYTISVCAPVEEVGSIDESGRVKEKSKITDSKKCITVAAKYSKRSYVPLKRYKGKTITLADVKKDISKLDDFVSQFSISELVDFTVCNGSCWQPKKSGAAGKLAHSKKYGVPTLYMSDGNCSVNLNCFTTGFPSSNLLAGTFNKTLAYNVGKVLADESQEHGIAINLGPGANLHRNILCGRHPEYFSEDPILAGTLMAEQAKGQEENGVLATYKHFLANGMEFERKSAHSVIDERTVRELYLRVFDKAFSIYKPACVMTSYNPVNGIYPCENSELLNDLLREQWGFNGFIMTDWGSYDTADSVKMINAGLNLLTPGMKKYYKMIKRAVKKGEISKGTLQNSVKQIIKVLMRCV